MLEEVASNWINGLHFFFDVTNFVPTVPKLWDKQFFSAGYVNYVEVRQPDILLGYIVLFWTVLYFMYEKCLNLLLRRMRLPLMQRSIIIESAWNCGFCVGSICYLKSTMNRIPNVSFETQQATYDELGIIVQKSFYFHRAAVEILRNGIWIRGATNLLFASSIMNSHREKWCTVVSTLLFYKAIDTVIINTCRILLCLTQFVGRKLPKVIFFIHAFNWIYLYIIFVPKLMLWPEKHNDAKITLGLWLWFITECLDSVWWRLLNCARATHWLEICLFPPPTQEAIQLANIQKKHRESLRKLSVDRAERRTQMWQTLMCVMAIKSKVKRIRRAKENEGHDRVSSNCLPEDVKARSENIVSAEYADDGATTDTIKTAKHMRETEGGTSLAIFGTSETTSLMSNS